MPVMLRVLAGAGVLLVAAAGVLLLAGVLVPGVAALWAGWLLPHAASASPAMMTAATAAMVLLTVVPLLLLGFVLLGHESFLLVPVPASIRD